MKLTSFFTKNRIAGLLCAGFLSLMAVPHALATDLPPGVLNYLRQKDPHVKVRFDGVVLFSNGESYVPVIPQDPSLNTDSQQVISTIPDKVPYPDLIQFDNNFFLMRLIQTASGRLTFPKLADYPIQLKEGLLPQDFVMPSNLYIPVELKIILGALPYDPSYKPSSQPPVTPTAVALQNAVSSNGMPMQPMSHVTYVFDLDGQKILAIDPTTGHKLSDVGVDCVPSSMRISSDGKLLFVPCLSSNELVVVDTNSNLVKTRISVGQRPDAVLYINRTGDVVVSNRYSTFLSVVNGQKLTDAQQVGLPGNSGAMAVIPGSGVPKLVVADAFNAQVYLVDLNTMAVEKTFKALPDISAVKVFRDTKGHMEIWVASRTKDQVMALDGVTGNVLKTLDVGEKPVDMVAYDDKLFVVSAGDSRIDVINRPDQSKYTTIQLEADSFPSGLVLVPSEKRGYVTLAASHNFVVLNLDTLQVDNTLPVDFRAGMIAMTPDKQIVEQEQLAMPVLAPGQPKDMNTTGSQKANIPEPRLRKQVAKPESQKENKKKQMAKQAPTNLEPGSSKEAKIQDRVSGQNNASAGPIMPSQSLPGEASGKLHLKLGREKSKNKTSPGLNPPPATQAETQAEIQLDTKKQSIKPMALPLDLQVADPAPIASPKQQLPGSSSTGAPTTQDDVVK
jgi:YVTN family beta-propeller protein